MSLTFLVGPVRGATAVTVDGARGLGVAGRGGGHAVQARHAGRRAAASRRVPGVVSGPRLAVQQTELVIHGASEMALLGLRGQVPEHTVDGGHLYTTHTHT